MFKYRAKRKDNGEIVIGCLVASVHALHIVISTNHYEGYKLQCNSCEIEPESLAISTGINDINGVEVYGSFSVNGVMMSDGGDDVLLENYKRGKVKYYLLDACFGVCTGNSDVALKDISNAFIEIISTQ